MTTAAKQHQTINSGYAYCVGIDYFGRKEPCKSCRRMFSFNFPTETGLTWIQPQYDETTGKCPFYDAKTDNDNFNNNNEK